MLARSTDPATADAAAAALDGMALKWTYNPNQSRIGGRFAAGTGGNQTTAKPVGGGVKPVNAAAAQNTAGARPVNPAAARLTPQPAVLPPPTGTEATARRPVGQATTAPAGETLTVSHQATAQTAQQARRDASHERADQDTVRRQLAAAKIPAYATNADRDKAVAAMEKKYKLPASAKGLSKAEQRARAAMKSETRKLTTAKAEQARVQARVNAIKAAIKAGHTDANTAHLNAQLAAAQARLTAAKTKTRSIQAAFDKAAKTWKHHRR